MLFNKEPSKLYTSFPDDSLNHYGKLWQNYSKPANVSSDEHAKLQNRPLRNSHKTANLIRIASEDEPTKRTGINLTDDEMYSFLGKDFCIPRKVSMIKPMVNIPINPPPKPPRMRTSEVITHVAAPNQPILNKPPKPLPRTIFFKPAIVNKKISPKLPSRPPSGKRI